jgi:hypothetical protein
MLPAMTLQILLEDSQNSPSAYLRSIFVVFEKVVPCRPLGPNNQSCEYRVKIKEVDHFAIFLTDNVGTVWKATNINSVRNVGISSAASGLWLVGSVVFQLGLRRPLR